MTVVLDASVALKWFAVDEPLADAAGRVLKDIEHDPRPYLVPELFVNELVGVMVRTPGATAEHVQEAVALVEELGLTRVGNGHDVLSRAVDFAFAWRISGYDAVYLAVAELTGGVWLTADSRAARRVKHPGLVRLLAEC